VAEGTPSTAYYLTINGAVEKVLVRGDRRIRVGLAGPGKAFGYESLIDGRPSPVTAITRERALLLVVPGDLFKQLFNGEDAVSRGFLDVIQKDLIVTLRETLRPYARLAASGYVWSRACQVVGGGAPVRGTRSGAGLEVIPRCPHASVRPSRRPAPVSRDRALYGRWARAEAPECRS
jgi:hypothetical protein